MKTQVIKCKCGKIFAACNEPECYTDTDWKKDVEKYFKNGCDIDLIDRSTLSFGVCTCKPIVKQLKLEL